jgi:5-methylcytosine-specific restriction endonuclease McrA
MTRKRLTTSQRVEIFTSTGGVCHICGGRISGGQAWEVEHVIPLALGGLDKPQNMRPAHPICHREKTSVDAGDTARAKRREAKHIGAKAPSRRPMPGSRASRFKKRMDGTVVRRET